MAEFIERAGELIKTEEGKFVFQAFEAIKKGGVFLPRNILLQKLKTQFFSTTVIEQETADRVSMLGTPVISNLEFPAGSFRDLDDNIIEFEGIRIDTVLFTVNQAKNIITTPIVGRNGTVKEYISDGDFVITAELMIVGETQEGSDGLQIISIGNRMPERDIRTFIKICQVPESVEVLSRFLDFFEIKRVVIETYDMPQEQGKTNTQLVTLNMLSDEPIELQ